MRLNRTYLTKCASIIKNSDLNTGLNPVAEICYGKVVTRMLCYFDHNKIKKLVEDKTYPDISKLKHTLKMYNVGSVDPTTINCGRFSSVTDDIQLRAASFDLIFFLIPMEWDNGKGFDYSPNLFSQGLFRYFNMDPNEQNRLVSTDGASWYQARNGYDWEEEGVYSNERLSKEYDNFSSEVGSTIVIGRQHFDIGNEDISLDITDIFNKFITGELTNYGIGVAFSPLLESSETECDIEKYVSFFTPKTNTIFEPFVETEYDDVISDDRSYFPMDKNNKLYLYCNVGGMLVDLDEIPVCTIQDKEYEVKQFSKGIYYIEINTPSSDFKPYTMLYDTWSNIRYNGVDFGSIEMDFTLLPNEKYFNFGNTIKEDTKVVPTVYGINPSEKIKRGDIRKVNILARVKYSKNKAQLVNNMYARVYVKDGNREIEIFPYMQVNKTSDENYFTIDTNILIPNRYYIDVKMEYNRETIYSKEVLQFDIVNEIDGNIQ